MEITQIAPGCIRIKGKQGILLVDPTPLMKTKTQADAIIFTSTAQEYDESKIENARLVVSGPGEYEISGIKISGANAKGGISYLLRVDNVELFCLRASNLEKNTDLPLVKPVVVLNTDAKLSDTAGITDTNPAVIVSYGEHAAETGAAFGKEGIDAVTKFQTTLEKLPTELEVVILE